MGASKGHDAFEKATAGQSAAKVVATLIAAGGRKVTREAVRRWRQGLSTPGDDTREAIRSVYAIPVAAWDGATAAPAAPDGPEPSGQNSQVAKPPPPAAPADAMPRAGGLTLPEVEALIAEARAKREGASAMFAGGLINTEARLLALAARLRGDLNATITEAAILRHPAFTRVLDAVLRAAEPYPDAVRAIHAAVSALD